MKNCTLTPLLLLITVFCASSSNAPEEKPSSWFWQQGLEYARKGQADSAFMYMKQAFGKGISDDSLYYLWAEIYLYRSVLDTALALNFSIKPPPGSALRTLAFKQRYTVYSMLGWSDKAESMLDSLGRKPSSKLRRFVPECNLFISGGGFFEDNIIDKKYPYPRLDDSAAVISNGNGVASLRIGWIAPIGKTHRLQFGGRLRYAGSRFSPASTAAHLNDSADAAAGGFLQYSMLSDLLAMKYTCSRKRDFMDIKSYLHQVSLRYAMLNGNWLGSIEGGYHYEFPTREHYYYLMTYWDREIGRKNEIAFTLFLSGTTAKAYSFDESVPCIYVKDAAIYQDSSFTQQLTTTLGLLQESTYGRMYHRRIIPQSCLAVNPHLRYQYRLTKQFAAGAAAGYLLSRYCENYTWTDMRYAPADIPAGNGIRNIYTGTESFLAFNAADRQYYWVRSIRSVNQVTLDSVPVTFNSVQRIDQALSLNLFFKWSSRRLGVVMFDLTGRRNFSTLMESAPIDIQRWYGEAMLSWFFQFKPDVRP